MGIVRISRAFFGWILLVSMAASWTGGATIGICQEEKSFESLVQTVFTLDTDVDVRVYDHFLEVLGAAPRGEDDMIKQIALSKEPLFKNFMVRRFKNKKSVEILLVDGNKDDEAAYLFLTNEKAELITCLYKVKEEKDGRTLPDEVAGERFAKERDWWLEWKQHNKHLLEEADKDQ
jgi:hypothetical protein